MIFFKDQTNIAISFCTAYAELEVCPTCTVQCLAIFLQYFFRYYTENRTPKVKQEPWDYVVHLPKLAITIYILLLSGKVNHKETHLNWQFFFFLQNFSLILKGYICNITDSHLVFYMPDRTFECRSKLRQLNNSLAAIRSLKMNINVICPLYAVGEI